MSYDKHEIGRTNFALTKKFGDFSEEGVRLCHQLTHRKETLHTVFVFRRTVTMVRVEGQNK